MTTQTTTVPTIVVFGSAVLFPGSCHDIDVIYSGCSVELARAAVTAWAAGCGIGPDRPIDLHPELASVGEDGMVTVTIPRPKWCIPPTVRILAGSPAITDAPRDGLAARIRAFCSCSDVGMAGSYEVGLDPAGEDGYDGDGATALANAVAHLRRHGDRYVEDLEREAPGLLAVIDAIVAGVAEVPLSAAITGGGTPSTGGIYIHLGSGTGGINRQAPMPLARLARVLRGERVHTIVAVGSVDGVLTAAALVLALRARGEVAQVLWCQASTVDSVEVPMGQDLWLVDLAVDQRDPTRTSRWLTATIRDRGARLRGVIDEHGAAAWEACLSTVRQEMDVEVVDLEIGPRDTTSAGAVLSARLDGWYRGSHRLLERAMQLALEANLADLGDFLAGVRRIANAAIKADIRNDAMRTAIVAWLTGHDLMEAPQEILAAVKSYEDDVRAQVIALDGAVIAEDGAVDIAAHGVRDLTAIAFAGYARWPGRVLVVHTGDRVLFCEQVQRHGGAQSVIDRLAAAIIPHAGIAGRVGVLHSDYSEEVRRIALGLPRWRLAPAPGITLPEDLVAIRFSSRAQAWRAAEGLLGGCGEAVEGPHGVAALVSVVEE